MSKVYVEFSISISENQYRVYDNQVSTSFTLTEDFINSLDTGNIFQGLMQAACLKYQENKKQKEGDETK